jgi:hypothetical protein
MLAELPLTLRAAGPLALAAGAPHPNRGRLNAAKGMPAAHALGRPDARPGEAAQSDMTMPERQRTISCVRVEGPMHGRASGVLATPQSGDSDVGGSTSNIVMR